MVHGLYENILLTCSYFVTDKNTKIRKFTTQGAVFDSSHRRDKFLSNLIWAKILVCLPISSYVPKPLSIIVETENRKWKETHHFLENLPKQVHMIIPTAKHDVYYESHNIHGLQDTRRKSIKLPLFLFLELRRIFIQIFSKFVSKTRNQNSKKNLRYHFEAE